MQLTKISLAETRQFSKILADYLNKKPQTETLYTYPPDYAGIEKVIADWQWDTQIRKNLHQVLVRQYAGYEKFPEATLSKLLNPNTFTVTTGHQLNIFSGPLYVIYKLVTTINLAKQLKEKFPEYDFVPVYWMATEDHDFDEINHFELFGKKYEWQTSQSGAVGRMNPQEIAEILSQMPEKVRIFEEAYLKHDTLAGATRFWVNELFGEDGLICLDADDAELKVTLQRIMEADILEGNILTYFEEQTQKLESLGYERQINSREINFFYLDNSIRGRIVKNGDKYEVLNTNLSFTEAEIKKLIAENPEKLSPNVVLRPVYQQLILPNLAYIGGPAEVVYWFQLREIFRQYEITYPVLLPRNFSLFINKTNAKKLEKLGIKAEDLFADENELKRNFIEKNAENPVDIQAELTELNKLFESLIEKALKTDASLEGFVKAERQKSVSSLENIEKRFRKAEEQKQAVQVNQLIALRQKLFPEGGLQERHDNFLSFYLNNPDFLNNLKENFDPLDFSFYIFTEE